MWTFAPTCQREFSFSAFSKEQAGAIKTYWTLMWQLCSPSLNTVEQEYLSSGMFSNLRHHRNVSAIHSCSQCDFHISTSQVIQTQRWISRIDLWILCTPTPLRTVNRVTLFQDGGSWRLAQIWAFKIPPATGLWWILSRNAKLVLCVFTYYQDCSVMWWNL